MDAPWSERVLSALVESPWGAIEIHTTGIPPGASNGWIKVEALEGIYRCLACRTDRLRVLCGDFNTPQAELGDGQIVTWAQEIALNGNIRTLSRMHGRDGRVDTGARWDAAERSVLSGLAQFDLADVFRTLHGYGVQASSWYWKGNGRLIGRRFDHVFASRGLNAVRCQYLHDFREIGFSDHAPIEVEFKPATALSP